MAEKDIDFSKLAAEIQDVTLADEVEKSYLSYSYMVILQRSLPDVRDGLKTVHRRILYSMYASRAVPERPHVKVQRIAGDVMGVYHPHGDSSISDSLVRLAQDFSLRVPLIDGHGNFGMPGVRAASPRYIEAKLAKPAMFMLEHLNEDAVPMRPNYDAQTEEPTVLPTRFPNLVINGSSGIAVGMATKVPQHNPDEVMNAARHLLRNPNATLKQIMKFIPAPDFATGGTIIGLDQVEQAYKTGRGIFRIRGAYTVTPSVRGRHLISFYELPFEAAPEKIIEDVKKAINQGKLVGLYDAKDLTDRRNGTRLVFETKAGVRPEMIAAELFKTTGLEVSFGANQIAIVNGSPKVVGLVEMLQHFISFRKETVLRQTAHKKGRQEARLHIVKGLLKALLDIDRVIKIVRNADSDAVAKTELIKKFKVDATQADYILDIPLRRLTKLNKIELETERDRLMESIKNLTRILKDKKVLEDLLYEEFGETKKIISSPRRTKVSGVSLEEHLQAAKAIVEQAEEQAEVEDAPCFVVLTARHGLQRVATLPKKSLRAAVQTTTKSQVVAVTSQGRGIKVDVLHVGEKEGSADISLPMPLAKGEQILTLAPFALEEGKVGGIAFGTKKGIVKITSPQWPVRSDDFSLISLEAGDEVVSASWIGDVEEDQMVFITSQGMLLTYDANKVRPQGLSGSGVAGIALKDGAYVVSFSVVKKALRDRYTVVVATKDRIKATTFTEALYPSKGRATGGYTVYSFRKGESDIVLANVVEDGVFLTSGGQQMKLPSLINKRVASGEPRQ